MRKNKRNDRAGERKIQNAFGVKIREIRYQKGIGIKKLAPELGIDYSYLSRIENSKVIPSSEMIERLSKYFDYDKDELMLLADRVPEDIMRILREKPQETLALIRGSLKENAKRP